MAITNGGGGRAAGTIFDWPGTVAPPGAMALPIAATNVSRSAYAKIFLAIGTVWGAGDGVTTFGLPWCAADETLVQASGNVGTQTAGANITHTHGATQAAHRHGISTPYGGGSASYIERSAASFNPTPNTGAYTHYETPVITVNATGGSANLAAGSRVLKCIQYL